MMTLKDRQFYDLVFYIDARSRTRMILERNDFLASQQLMRRRAEDTLVFSGLMQFQIAQRNLIHVKGIEHSCKGNFIDRKCCRLQHLSILCCKHAIL